MKRLRIAAAAMSALLLTGCGGATRTAQRELAALEYQFYPVTDAMQTEPEPALLSTLRTGYDNMLARRDAQLHAALQPGLEELVNLVPEDPVLPLSRFSPTVKLLFAETPAVNMNPVLVMRQVLAGMQETQVAESEITRSTDTAPLSAVPEGRNTIQKQYISDCLRKYYYDMPYQVSYSEPEDLYYVYLFDAREQLTVMALYFRFDNAHRLAGVGFDSMLYDPYELTLTEGLPFAPLTVPEDPSALDSFQKLRDMALVMLGAEQYDTSPLVPGSNVELTRTLGSCTHEHEVQYYYAGEKGSANLLAVRMMDWYLYVQDTAEPVQETGA